jgi:hypothetical protein
MTPRDIWESAWDVFTLCTVFFFKGWQYVSVVVGIFTVYTMLTVSNFTEHIPESLRFGIMFYAILIMFLIVLGAGAFGSVAFYKAGKRENNMVLRNSTELQGLFEGTNTEIQALKTEITALRNEIKSLQGDKI